MKDHLLKALGAVKRIARIRGGVYCFIAAALAISIVNPWVGIPAAVCGYMAGVHNGSQED